MTSLIAARAYTGTIPTRNTWQQRFAKWAGKDAEFMAKDKDSDFGCRLGWPGRRKTPPSPVAASSGYRPAWLVSEAQANPSVRTRRGSARYFAGTGGLYQG